MTTIGSLCSGTGAMELGLGQVWHDLSVAWHADPDPGATTLLAHRYPSVPNLGDLTIAQWDEVEPVDIITAGWPCQPFSMAGKRKGAADERAIWPSIADAIRTVRPRIVVLENVVAVAGAGELARACADLAQAGYVGSWRSIRASDVGAPHKRDRLFVVAVATDPGCGSVQRRPVDPSISTTPGPGVSEGLQRERWGPGTRHDGAPVTDTTPIRRDPRPGRSGVAGADPRRPAHRRGSGRGAPAADTDGGGFEERPERHGEPIPGFAASHRDDAVRFRAAAPDPEGQRRRQGRPEHEGLEGRPGDAFSGDTDWAEYGFAIERWSVILGRPAPAPTVLGRRGGPQLNPVFVEWVMGLPAGWVTDVPGLTRIQQLKLLGNGCVPRQCAVAVRSLLTILDENEVAA